MFGHREIFGQLLGRGADVNLVGGRYGTALQAALVGRSRSIVKLLLENGADVNARGTYRSALQAALSDFNGHEIAQILLHHGARHSFASNN